METDLAKKALRNRLIAFGYSQAMASNLVNSKQKPGRLAAAKFETEYGIPAASWADGAPLQEMWNQLMRNGQ